MDFWKFQPRKRVKWLCQERRLGHAPGEARKRPKCCPGGTKMRPRGAKTGSRAAQKHQDEKKKRFLSVFGGVPDGQESPQEPPRAPKRGQEAPKRGPRGSQEGPQRSPRGSKKGRRCGARGTRAKHRKNLRFFSYPPWQGGYSRVTKNREKSSKIEPGWSKNRYKSTS